MADDLTLAMRLYADARRWVSGLRDANSGTRQFVASAKREFSELTAPLRSIQGQLAGIGAGFVATQQVIQSARLDKNLTQIALTAGEGQEEVAGLRDELFRLAQETGRPVEDLRQGFNNLIQSGLSWEEALRVIQATNKAMAVTDAQASALTGGLTVAAEAFDFDLTQPERALQLLDRMTVAGRLGNAELENLSGIFARVGVNARDANLSFEDTLAFIEGLSLIERNPERLATLADSTLRLFTNLRYLRGAQQATGVQFFEESGARRNPLEVLQDLRTEFQKLQTDAQRATFIQGAFGNADLDTQRGLRALLSGDSLSKVQGFTAQIAAAGGTLNRDLDKALDNSIDQVGRLQAALSEAVDKGFSQPINKTISEAIKFGLNKEGLNLSGGEIIAGGAALTVGTLLTARYGGKGLGALGRRLFPAAGGLAAGKALEETVGVTPVFVTNWPVGTGAGGFAGAGGVAGGSRGMSRAGRFASGGLGVGLAATGGWAFGTWLNQFITGTKMGDRIGEGIARALAAVGNDEARRAVAAGNRAGTNQLGDDFLFRTALESSPLGAGISMADRLFNERQQLTAGALMRTIMNPGAATAEALKSEMSGEIRISVSDDRVRVSSARTGAPGLDFDVRNGPPMVMQ